MARRRTNGLPPCSEAELAAEAKRHFEAQGFECWAEIEHIDIVARRGAEVIGIEVKKQFDTKLVEQALHAMNYCGAAYMVTPKVAGGATKYIREAVIEKSGLGCIEVMDWGWPTSAHGRFEIRGIAEPTRRLHDGLKCITDLLVPEAKNWTEPGKPSCRAVTKFRVTALRVRDYVADHPGCTVREVIEEVKTHWRKGNEVARLLDTIENGGVEGVKIVTRCGLETALIPLSEDSPVVR